MSGYLEGVERIALCTHGLSDLRYFIPLCLALKDRKPQIVFVIAERNTKYNGFDNLYNLELFKRIVTKHVPWVGIWELNQAQIQQVPFDVVFNIEISPQFSTIPAKRRVALQHFLDFWDAHARKAPLDVEYWMWSKHSQDLLKGLGLCLDSKVMFPMAYRPEALEVNLEKGKELLDLWPHRGDRPVVTLFWPQSGFLKSAEHVHRVLTEAGAFVVTKQRRKHTPIPGHIQPQVYDASWFPSEGVCLPLVSKFSIGFGTTAYIDLIEAGLKFIDIRIQPWCFRYPVPEHENYYMTHVVDEGLMRALMWLKS